MRKNTAGQHVTFGLVVASTGAGMIGGSPVVSYSLDGAARVTATGALTSLGLGMWDYAPSQAETNANAIGLFITASSGIPVAMTLYTTAANPSDSVRLGLTALPNAAASATSGLGTLDANGQILSTLSSAAVDLVHDDVTEGAMTFRQMIRVMYAALAGKASGGGTLSIKFRDLGDTKDRISATVTADGDRTAVVVDGT